MVKVKLIQTIILFCILGLLASIRVSIEKWGAELTLTKVTTVEHKYNYNVESYGTIRLNDKLVTFTERK
jgi:hypothetical protein